MENLTTENPEILYDREETMDRVGGDEVLLKEIIDIFFSECPKMMEQIKNAINSNDSDELQSCAHALKGAIGNFSAKQVYETAYTLERLGQKKQLSKASEVFFNLQKEVEQLRSQLKSEFPDS